MSASQDRVLENTRPFDLAVASYEPRPIDLVDALWGRDQPADRYVTIPPPAHQRGAHLEFQTLNPTTS